MDVQVSVVVEVEAFVRRDDGSGAVFGDDGEIGRASCRERV